MKLTLLIKDFDGPTNIKVIELRSFRWLDDHKFTYQRLNADPLSAFETLAINEDIVGLTI